MSRPSKRMRPASGASSPESWLISVVLPAPFGPITRVDLARPTSSRDVVGGDEAAEALDQACRSRAARQPWRPRLRAAARRPGRRDRFGRTARSARSAARGRASSASVQLDRTSSSTRSASAPTTGPRRADAAEHHHHDELARRTPVHVRGADERRLRLASSTPARPQIAPADHEGGELVAEASGSRARACALVRLRAAQHHAEARVARGAPTSTRSKRTASAKTR